MATDPPLLLTDVPHDCLAAALALLPPPDLAAAARACTHLSGAAADAWRVKCGADFGGVTDPRAWLARGGGSGLPPRPPPSPGGPSPARSTDGADSDGTCPDFRSVYRLLTRLSRLVGLWRDDGGSLVALGWRRARVAAERLTFSATGDAPPLRTRIADIGPSAAAAVVDVTDASRCVLRSRRPRPAGDGANAVAAGSPAAGAAAAVATGLDADVLGTSPVGSFEREMLRFMGSVVAARGGRRARSRPRGGPGSAGGGGGAVTHLTRVVVPVATRAHPLAGLWRAAAAGGDSDDDDDLMDGDDDVHRRPPPQIVALTYDFAGPTARIVATVVAGGPPGGPAPGDVAWTAAAAPLPKPWPVKDAALIGLRWLLVGGGDDHERGGAGAAAFEPRDVAAVHRGRGAVPPARLAPAAAATPPSSLSCEGRLWRYADGRGIAFVWLPGGGSRDAMVEYEPVPPDHVR